MTGVKASNLKVNKLKILLDLCKKYNLPYKAEFESLTTKNLALSIKNIRREYQD